MTTATTIFENIVDGACYRVAEVFNPQWERCVPLYMVERNQGNHNPRFFNIYIGEDKSRALWLAGLGC